MTDPPYFDFIHYSELSDFFFAWLGPSLASRHPWMNGADCFHVGEVQHRDPRVFGGQLARVFSECCRVMKEEGVLAFSFHHSRPEGWAAIHEAIERAGLGVVAAHAVHAELRVSSPKSAARDPINLDAILVCRKRDRCGDAAEPEPIGKVDEGREELSATGVRISRADRFVIAAAQTLVKYGKTVCGYEDMLARLSAVRDELMADSTTGE